ncbi:unnamed protein product [Adineta steineri]|uniref:Uncharacterized protein n=1 Tax=Adineta steineri TaxID=433720 RepID=A0A814YAR3_9BILA|nr:unnamed protein product [Adineta steineri]
MATTATTTTVWELPESYQIDNDFFQTFFINNETDESSSYSYPSPQHGIPNIYNSLSPPSILASQFSHLIGFSPISNDSTSRLIRRPNQSTISNSSPSPNLIFSLTGPNYFGLHYQQQRRDQQTTSTNTSTSNTSTSTHVLCR